MGIASNSRCLNLDGVMHAHASDPPEMIPYVSLAKACKEGMETLLFVN